MHSEGRSRLEYSGAMLDLDALDLGAITYALSDRAAYEHGWLIHSQTGEIVYWSAETGIDGHTKIDLDDLDPELTQEGCSLSAAPLLSR